eukprot:Em0002g72a
MGVVLSVVTALALRCLVAKASVLSLLAIVPFPSNYSSVGWSRGLELVPAGLLALKHINDTPEVLKGHTLELVVKEGEGCGASVVVKDIYSLYQELQVVGGRNVVGVVGLPCSTPAGALSKLAGHVGLDVIQISGSSSPALSDRVKYPRLYRVASSVGIVDSIISFMKDAKWKRISIYNDEQGLYFKTIAQLLVNAVRNDTEMKLGNEGGGLTAQTDVPSVEKILNVTSSIQNKIKVIIGTEHQCSVFLCAAYKRKRTWPDYVYILPDRDVKELLNTDVCDAQTMMKAVEGVFTVNVALSAANDSVLISGKTYQEYRLEYLQELSAYSERTGYPLDSNDNIYVNSLYDEVWSFALALNSSLHVLDARNLSLENFRFNSGQISDILEEALQKLEFQGASGRISFKNNRQPITSFSMHQIVSGRAVLVATYNGSLTITENFSLVHLPPDSISIDRVYILDPLWLMIIIVCICGLSLILLVFNAALLIRYRNGHDIKASSPSLSLLMFVGCILLDASVLAFTFRNMYTISNEVFSVILCNAEVWSLSLGTNLIINTLFVRLFRVYRLFQPNNFKKAGRMCRDEMLVIYILLLTTYSVLVLLIWAVSDLYQMQEEVVLVYASDATTPYFSVEQHCGCRYETLWLSLLFLLSAVLTLGVVLLAVLTRHIKRSHFKDTKKVNICIFTSILALTTLLTLWRLFDAIELHSWAHLTLSVAVLFVPMACQVTLYVPKTVPYLCCPALHSARTIKSQQSSLYRL